MVNTSIHGVISSKMCVYWSLEKSFGKWKHVQPSGSMEGCVSEHGVYDQLGNAWEWVDLGRIATRDEWVAYLGLTRRGC